METKDFIKKYRLGKSKNFPYNKFLGDFRKEFIDTMLTMNGYDDMQTCRFCINSMRALWDNINEEAYSPLPEFLWKIFYRNTVCSERRKVRGFNQKSIDYKRSRSKNYETAK